MQRETPDTTRKACWTITASPTPPFQLSTLVQIIFTIAPGTFKFDKMTQSLMLRRYCHLGICVNDPFSLPTTSNHPYLPHRIQLFVGPTHFGFLHPQPVAGVCFDWPKFAVAKYACGIIGRESQSRSKARLFLGGAGQLSAPGQIQSRASVCPFVEASLRYC